ncbi:BPTF [Cordylochernes scorpioides]|uniref:BPTF n=1 Tax=Cordylochernes scorpioides TaxID=51811 RepID=A0ABY6LHS6_9ARAC|nr:BPTF [Cordylochernes scorpioides]
MFVRQTFTRVKPRAKPGIDGIQTRSKQRSINLETLTARLRKEEEQLALSMAKEDTGGRITRSKAQASSASPAPSIFKLGLEHNYKSYVNHYTVNTLALNKHHHAEERDKKRHLSHKFSLTTASEFKWHGTMVGTRTFIVTTLRQTVLQLESQLAPPTMHLNWPVHKANWVKAVNMCNSPRDFALALSILEGAMKPVLFNHVWRESLGHTRLRRSTAVEREEKKKQEKRERREIADDDLDRTVGVRYTLGLKHQVYKQKGEEYRLTGKNAWRWVSRTRTFTYSPAQRCGLRSGPQKIVVSLRGGQGGIKVVDLQALMKQYHPEEVEDSKEDSASKSTPARSVEEYCLEVSNNYFGQLEVMKKAGIYEPVQVELVNISESLSAPARLMYPKIAKASKLDSFLERRLKMLELSDNSAEEKKPVVKPSMPSPIVPPAVSALKKPQPNFVKIQIKNEDAAASKLILAKLNPDLNKEKSLLPNGILSLEDQDQKGKFIKPSPLKAPGRTCYSSSCRIFANPSSCYSPTCPFKNNMVVNGRDNRFRSLFGELLPNNGKIKIKKDLLAPLTVGQESLLTPKKEEPMEVDSKPNNTTETANKVYLAKITKVTKKPKKMAKGSLPPCWRFTTALTKKKNIMILPTHELKRLSRRGGNREVTGFSYSAKNNPQIWPYGSCPRPSFRTSWLYRNQILGSLHAAALQLRVLWACLRWDDLQAKPPPSGTNTVTTETEVLTTEILKRREVGPYKLRSEYLVRRITVPIDLPSRPREKITPQRSGLRERRRPESPLNKGPTVTEAWVPEEDLEIWEIKQFGEKIEKQSLVVVKEKPAAGSQQSGGDKLRVHMETQLKQQRHSMQQKRLQEVAGGQAAKLALTKPITLASSSSPKPITLALPGGVSSATTPTLTKVAVVTSVNKPGITTFISNSPNNVGGLKGVRRIFQNSRNATKTDTPVTTGTATIGQPQTAPLVTAAPATTPVKLAPGTTILPKNPQFILKASGGPTIVRPTTAFPIRAATTTTTAAARPTLVSAPRPQIQIIQTPTGHLQVRGLQPGQQLIRLNDGRLQLLTIPTTVQQAVATTTTPNGAPATLQLSTGQQFKGTVATTTPAATIQGSKLIQIRPQQAATAATPVRGGPAPVRLQPLTLPGGAGGLTALVTTPLLGATASTTLLQPKPSATAEALTSPPGSPQQQHFVLTPAITQQIVKQALMNQQTSPEIQQKLLALQRHHQKQLDTGEVTVPVKALPVPKPSLLPPPSLVVAHKTTRICTPEQKEDSSRYGVCQQVIRGMLDKIEREEKSTQRRQKAKESAEERKVRANAHKLQAILFKETELLRREIMKKRALIEKELQIEIQAELQEDLAKRAPLQNSNRILTPPTSTTVSRQVSPTKTVIRERKRKASESERPAVVIKKQKLAASPKPSRQPNKLYCICKKPYDKNRFMVGCDMCYNWFHVECIGLSEVDAKNREKYVCTDCAAASQTTKEELYCLCKQPYDESQFYICCDRCQDWFHGRCVGVLQSEADSIDEYICPNCQSNTTINHANLKPLNAQDYENLRLLLKSLQVGYLGIEPRLD